MSETVWLNRNWSPSYGLGKPAMRWQMIVNYLIFWITWNAQTFAELTFSDFSVAKTFCTEDYNDEASYNGCNKEVLLPDAIEDNKAIECYQCQVSVDQRNQTLGTGERSCWDNPQERHLQKCSMGEKLFIFY